MAKSSGKVTIKKYANRRLYDTESSTYITLDRLAQMVREGREFEVVDAKSGEDITRQVLTQIIVDEEARGGDHAADQFPEAADRPLRQFDAEFRAAISRSGDGRVPAQPERGASDAFSGNMFADLAKRNMAMFEDASRAFTRQGKARSRAEASGSDVDAAEGRARRAPGQSRPAEPLTIMRFADCCGARADRRLVAPRADGPSPTSARRRRSPATGLTRTTADGSEATFADAIGQPQLSVHCTRATRRVTIAKPASAAAPFLDVWTSSQTRSLPASFNPATGRAQRRACRVTIRCSTRSRSAAAASASACRDAAAAGRAAMGRRSRE